MGDEEKSLVQINQSVFNFKGWEKPVEKLIHALSTGMGTLYEPARIRRRADAERYAELARAQTRIDVENIEQRADASQKLADVRRQMNIEAIASKAIPALPDKVEQTPVDDDWMQHFINYAQHVSNEKMQRIWSKLLAREVAQPGAFSLRCLRTVADLQAGEAELFTQLCSFVWQLVSHHRPICVVFDRVHSTITRRLNWENFLVLEHAGFIRLSDLGAYSINASKGQISLEYFGRNAVLTGFSNEPAALEVGSVILTSVGSELVRIAGGEADDEYFNAVRDWWKAHSHLTVADS